MLNKTKTKNLLISFFVVLIIFSIIYIGLKSQTKNENENANYLNQNTTEENYLLFEDLETGMRFNYPKDFSFYKVEQDIGYSIVVESDDSKTGFQINILPWDEGEQKLTQSRIRKDLPNLEMKNFGEVELPIKNDKINTVTFLTSDDRLGEIREVWFIKNNYLFQFSIPKDANDLIDMIFNTMEL